MSLTETQAIQPSLPSASETTNRVGDIEAKYAEERDKRLRPDGLAQFVDLYALDKFRHFKSDPWVEYDSHPERPSQPHDGSSCEILILGGGWSGMVYAVRLLQAGFKLEDIRIVDNASGFGGTWYWNRYPGLTCDVESYIYMPLLEETNYVPTMKYTSGKELREHAERIAAKWDLNRSAWFRHRVTNLEWNNDTKDWGTRLVPQLNQGREGDPITVRSRFVVLATGLVVIPHIPQLPGLEKFKGDSFHTARWDYHATGGTPDKPELVKLKDKRVGIIGTGATAVQVVPSLVPWAKEILVFQRTPSAIDRRDNKPTDPEWARAVCSQPGWQKKRSENFHRFLTNDPVKPTIDMVSDGWSRMPSYSALTGGPGVNCRTPGEVKKHLEQLHAIDLPRQEGIRKRVDELVEDPKLAEKLKAWYPGWCKRPCFHDEYLQCFNKPHVKLIDTNGQGVSEATEDGLKVGNEEYKIDTLVLSTGYRSIFLNSPAGRVNIDIKGRNGVSFEKKWKGGVATLHGVMSNGFPNLFWPGFLQATASPNWTSSLELYASHMASVMSHAMSKCPVNSDGGDVSDKYRLRFTIEPTVEAEEEWADLVATQAGAFAGLGGCTPNVYNGEGELAYAAESQEEQKRRARMTLWAKGPKDFAEVLADWRVSKDYKGLKIISTS
ncbi:hypothetical protein NW767_011938 [Fusarium falciforme]|nr:hypothetical protein NW767_011938 [Fusarium falciforme]